MFYPFEVFLVVEQTVGSTMSGIFKGLDVRINLVAVRYQFMKLRLILRVVAGCSSVRAHDRTGERPFSTHSVVNAGRVSYRRVRVEERFLVEQFALSPCRAFRHVRRQQVRRTVFGQRLLALRTVGPKYVGPCAHSHTGKHALRRSLTNAFVPRLAFSEVLPYLFGSPLRKFLEHAFRNTTPENAPSVRAPTRAPCIPQCARSDCAFHILQTKTTSEFAPAIPKQPCGNAT